MLVYLNGRILPKEEATISPFDRGFLFGDSLYEGVRTVTTQDARGRTHRRIVGLALHIERLRAGLGHTGIEWDPGQIEDITESLLRANELGDAFVYIQISRGTPGPGDPVRHRVPPQGIRPTVFAFAQALAPVQSFLSPERRPAVTLPDERWSLGHLKSTSLMAGVLSTRQAAGAGAGTGAVPDAIFIRDGLITEASASNVLLVLPHRSGGGVELVTPSLDSAPLLPGITRALLLDAAPEIVERPVRADELRLAKEVVLVGTSTMLASVSTLDGRPLPGDGREAARLLRLLVDHILAGRDNETCQPLDNRPETANPHG